VQDIGGTTIRLQNLVAPLGEHRLSLLDRFWTVVLSGAVEVNRPLMHVHDGANADARYRFGFSVRGHLYIDDHCKTQ